MAPWFSVSIPPVGLLTVSSPVPNQQQQPIVEDVEDLIVQAEASEGAIVEDAEDLIVQAEASEDAIVEDGEDLQIQKK